MASIVCGIEIQDSCIRWLVKEKHHVTVPNPNLLLCLSTTKQVELIYATIWSALSDVKPHKKLDHLYGHAFPWHVSHKQLKSSIGQTTRSLGTCSILTSSCCWLIKLSLKHRLVKVNRLTKWLLTLMSTSTFQQRRSLLNRSPMTMVNGTAVSFDKDGGGGTCITVQEQRENIYQVY